MTTSRARYAPPGFGERSHQLRAVAITLHPLFHALNGRGIVRDWIGHGVGRDVHEDPEVPNYGKPGTKLVLKPGMTIAIEPMITMSKKGEGTYVDADNKWTVYTNDGCLSAHFEHTVAITDDGCEVLTLPADYP